MPYYLLHHFDPTFDHTSLRPRQGKGGSADIRNLGYVQTVRKGDVLAVLVPVEKFNRSRYGDKFDLNFVLNEYVFPAGMNTKATFTPNYGVLRAACDGYVFYFQGKIVVKNLLNIRGSVGFNTGNIDFVAFVHVHENVKTGFFVRGRQIRVDGGVEGATIHSLRNIHVKKGVRSTPKNHCMLNAQGSVRLDFVDKAEILARENIVINSSLQASLFAGQNVVVKKRLNGGVCCVGSKLTVKGDLGTVAQTPTLLHIGCDPFLMRAMAHCQQNLSRLSKYVERYKYFKNNSKEIEVTTEQLLEISRKTYQWDVLLGQYAFLERNLFESYKKLVDKCVVEVPGRVFPGVTITMGEAIFHVNSIAENVRFRLNGAAIHQESLRPPQRA